MIFSPCRIEKALCRNGNPKFATQVTLAMEVVGKSRGLTRMQPSVPSPPHPTAQRSRSALEQSRVVLSMKRILCSSTLQDGRNTVTPRQVLWRRRLKTIRPCSAKLKPSLLKRQQGKRSPKRKLEKQTKSTRKRRRRSR